VLRRPTAFGLSARHDSATGDGISLFAARDDDRASCDHRGAHAHRHRPRHGDGVGAHAMGSRRTPYRRAAGCIRSSRSRDRPSDRLSLLSRGRGAHGVGRAGGSPNDGLVPRLSPRSGATTSPAGGHHDDGMASCPVGHERCTARRSGRPDTSPSPSARPVIVRSRRLPCRDERTNQTECASSRPARPIRPTRSRGATF